MTGFPIFYDATKKRWSWVKWPGMMILFVIVVFFVFTAHDIVQERKFEDVENITKSERNQLTPTDMQVLTEKNNSVIRSYAPQVLFKSTDISEDYRSRSIAFYVNWDDSSYQSLQKNVQLIDALMPEWLHLAGADGSIVIDNPEVQKKTVDFIRESDSMMKIVPLINNYNSHTQKWDTDMMVHMLHDQNARSHNIQSILQYVQEHDFDGINIDYESIPDTSQADLVLYMKELYDIFSAEGLEVSQSVPLVDDSFNVKALSQYTDFLVFMAYDEHFAQGTVAGPIASSDWFIAGALRRFLQVSPQKAVIAYGNYGYDWGGGAMDGKSVTVPEAMSLASDAHTTVQLDAQSHNEKFTYRDASDATHHVWFLDAVSIFNQIAAVDEYQPFGYALWRLGGEDTSLWHVIKNRDNLDQSVVDAIKNIPKNNNVVYDGIGEILRITHTPEDGKRDVIYDSKTESIIDASVVAYPSPYRIERFGGNDSKKIALTFDDGPDAKYTEQILDILKQKNVHATFFTIGLNASKHADILKRIDTEGHEIGSHTFTHPNINNISSGQFQLELNGFQKMLQGVIGRETILFRPPYAEDVEPETPQQIDALTLVNEKGYYTVGMHIDPKDWEQPGVDEIVLRVIDGIEKKQGNVVLLHDSGGKRDQTVDALPILIDVLTKYDYEIVLISELMGVPHDTVMPPTTVHNQFVTSINNITFTIIEMFLRLFFFLFKVGIFLGIARLVFISVLALVHARRRHQMNKVLKQQDFNPVVDVIVPAWNEESVIERTIDFLLESDYEHFHIFVVNDGSTDGTYQLLLQKYRHNEKVTILTKKNGGKAGALNYGIKRSNAPFIIALDADTLFTKDTIKMLIRNFSDPKIGAVAGNTKVGNRINVLTKLQALEYITSQNLERRAADVINAITVVPGAVGLWRRDVLESVGGFSQDTLAEDADLTVSIIKEGYNVVYEDGAIAYTEAPDVIINFNKQRFRWMYGTLQTGWKHKNALFRPKYGALGFFALPNIFIFQLLFQIIAPFIDIVLIIAVAWALWQQHIHQIDYSLMHTFKYIFFYYILFLMMEVTTAIIAMALEPKPRRWTLLVWIIFQRFFYRQLLYFVAMKTVYTAIKGAFVGWGKFERKNTSTIE